MRFPIAILLAASTTVAGVGCGSTRPAPRTADATLGALVAYVDAEVRIAADSAGCRDELLGRRSTVSVDTAICIAGFAQTLREGADVIAATATKATSETACAKSRSQMARSAHVLSDDWQRVVDMVRSSALIDTTPPTTSLRVAVTGAVVQADLLLAPDLDAYRKACLEGSEARSAEDLPERHRSANRSPGQTI